MKTNLPERLDRFRFMPRKLNFIAVTLLVFAAVSFGRFASQAAGDSLLSIEVPTYGQGYDIPVRPNQLKDSIGICGTCVIQVSYVGDVDFRIQSAFEYACRIWEDFIPMGYPIRIVVSQSSLPMSPKPMLSKVKIRTCDISGDTNSENNNQLLTWSKMKSVYFKEYGNHTQLSFFASMPYVLKLPDFSVTYNSDCLSMFEFNENSNTSGTYDFVSLAIRNIAQGLGFTCAFEADTQKREMIPLSREKLPFESIITRYNTYSYDRYVNQNNYIPALLGFESSYHTQRLQFTPVRVWEDGTTLCGFLPNNNVGLTFALGEGISYNTKIREIEDPNFSSYFQAYLGWPEMFKSDSYKIIGKYDISPNLDFANLDTEVGTAFTSNFREYFHLDGSRTSANVSNSIFADIDKEIKPYLVPGDTDGWYFQKTTGEWMLVCAFDEDPPYKIDPDTFDHETIAKNRYGQYRLALVYEGAGGISSVGCMYGPAPKVSMAVVSSQKRSSRYYTTIGLKATEALSKLEITETIKSSAGVTTTSTFEVTPGTRSLTRTYPDGSTVTLTPYSYIGSSEASKGNPLSFTFQQLSLPMVSNVNINNNDISFDVDSDDSEAVLQYSLTPLNTLSMQPIKEGDFNDASVIDISGLNPGIYVLRYQSGDGWESKTFTKK